MGQTKKLLEQIIDFDQLDQHIDDEYCYKQYKTHLEFEEYENNFWNKVSGSTNQNIEHYETI